MSGAYKGVDGWEAGGGLYLWTQAVVLCPQQVTTGTVHGVD